MNSTFIAYSNANFALIILEENSPSILQLISSSLIIQNNSHIYDQSIIVKAFLSSISFKDSKISQINLTNTGIEVVGSLASFENIEIDSIISNSTNIAIQFILALLESEITVNSLNYRDSNSILLKTRTSKTSLFKLNYININGAFVLFEISENIEVILSEITTATSSISSTNLFTIINSNLVSITDIIIHEINNTVFHIQKSSVTTLRNITIKDTFKGLEIITSTVNNITNSTFERNGNAAKKTGGSFKIIDSSVIIRDTIFRNNSAQIGAAIYFSCSSLKLCTLDVNDVLFQDNKAEVKGGSIYYDFARPILGGNITYVNNTAQYGPNIASYPTKVTFKDDPFAPLEISNLGSGIPYEKKIELALRDNDDQIMILDNESQIFLSSSLNNSKATLKGFNSKILRKGVATFDNFIVESESGTQQILISVTSNAINKNKLSILTSSVVKDNLIEVALRFCKPGEQIIENK